MNEIYDAATAAAAAVREDGSDLDYYMSPDALHGDRPPQIQLKSEQPWHRVLLYLKSRGWTNRRCAELLDTSEQYVSQISRQPWFRERLLKTLKAEGLPAVQEMLRSEAPESILKLVRLRDTAKSETVQAQCAMDLLDRYLGKAPTVIAENAQPLAAVDEQKLDADIARLQKQIARPTSDSAAPQGPN
jgi:hypothetical protein